jgi:hypothetical protein
MPIGAAKWWTDATPEAARAPQYMWRESDCMPVWVLFSFMGFGAQTPPLTGYAWAGPGYYGPGGTGIGILRGGSN